MTEPAYEMVGLAEVLDVAENGAIPFTGEGDAKMLGFLPLVSVDTLKYTAIFFMALTSMDSKMA